MSRDEVQAMIGKALDGEPPVGLDYETVLADGRRRQARRHLTFVAAAVLGVVAVAGATVAVTHNAARVNDPASQVSPEEGCGGAGMSGGDPSQEELAESARLTEAFSKFAFPALPAGVSMAPAKRKFCVVTGGWQATVALHGPKGFRSLYIDVQPRQGQPAGECGVPDLAAECGVRTVNGTATVRKTVSPAQRPSDPVLVQLVAWREDGTIVRLLETGSEVATGVAAPRIMSDGDLTKIALAPELQLNWTGSGERRAAEPSDRRAEELTRILQKVFVLPRGMAAVPMPEAKTQAIAFYPSQGHYKLNADLVDNLGKGNLFIVLSPPPPAGQAVTSTCDRSTGCEVVDLTDIRTGMLRRSSNGSITRLQLDTTTSDGGQLLIMVSNQSAAAGRTSGPSRPEPPLNREDLIRIANAPGLGW